MGVGNGGGRGFGVWVVGLGDGKRQRAGAVQDASRFVQVFAALGEPFGSGAAGQPGALGFGEVGKVWVGAIGHQVAE